MFVESQRISDVRSLGPRCISPSTRRRERDRGRKRERERKKCVVHERGCRPHWCASVCVYHGEVEREGGAARCVWRKEIERERERENAKMNISWLFIMLHNAFLLIVKV